MCHAANKRFVLLCNSSALGPRAGLGLQSGVLTPIGACGSLADGYPSKLDWHIDSQFGFVQRKFCGPNAANYEATST